MSFTTDKQEEDFSEASLALLKRLVSQAKQKQLLYTQAIEEARRHFAELAQIHKQLQKIAKR